VLIWLFDVPVVVEDMDGWLSCCSCGDNADDDDVGGGGCSGDGITCCWIIKDGSAFMCLAGIDIPAIDEVEDVDEADDEDDDDVDDCVMLFVWFSFVICTGDELMLFEHFISMGTETGVIIHILCDVVWFIKIEKKNNLEREKKMTLLFV
jgi:hypothetical protein